MSRLASVAMAAKPGTISGAPVQFSILNLHCCGWADTTETRAKRTQSEHTGTTLSNTTTTQQRNVLLFRITMSKLVRLIKTHDEKCQIVPVPATNMNK